MVELTGQNEQLLKETWLYGYAPDFTFASPTPQGMGMLKILAAGEVTMYIMKLSEAAAYFQKKGKTLNADTLPEILNTAAVDDLNAFCENGCQVFYVKQQKFEAVYVPAGYVLFERSSSAVLIYGLRKTVLLKGDPSDYQGVIDFVKASNKDVSRYEQCLERIVAAQQPQAAA